MQFDNLIIGAGDIAWRVAALLSAARQSAVLVGRSPGRKEDAVPLCSTLAADLDRPGSLAVLPVAGARLLYLAPPPDTGVLDPRVRNLCTELTRRLPQRPRGLVYISTSGVYGDCAGALVDETHPLHPQTDRARRRVDAEANLRAWSAAQQVPLIILRVAGIYGPGRLPLQRLEAGMPVLRPELAPASNRIHADDLARVCMAALERVEAGGIYNVCDGEATSMTDYFLSVARLFDLPAPELLDREEARQRLSPEMLSYLSESRRLDNRRLLQTLGVSLRYPNLDAGLRAIREQMAAVEETQ